MKYDLDEDTRAVLTAAIAGGDVEFEYATMESELWQLASSKSCALTAAAAGYKIRLKPRTMNINGHDVPWPMTTALSSGESYYLPCIIENTTKHLWHNDNLDRQWLRAGIMHLTEPSAELHAKALRSFFEVKE
jgi:hypothetical protein